MLVGRSPQQERLEGTLDRAGSPGTRIVALSGPAGIGKTALLTWACSRARELGHRVLRASAAEHQRDVAFSLVVEALDEAVRDLDDQQLEALGPDTLVYLSAVFPALATPGVPPPATGVSERHRIHMAIGRLTQTIARDGPSLLALDDLQWADSASIETIAHLVCRQTENPVLVLAYRSDRRLAGLLRDRLADAERAGLAETLALDPLGLEEVDVLVGALGSDADRALVYRESGGNPFYAKQLARARIGLKEEPGMAGAPDTLRGVPAAVLASIEREVAEVSDGAEQVLRASAITGEPFELELVGRIAALPETVVLSAIDELLACELVARDEVPLRYRFRHPIVRRAVYEATEESWRILAHRRAAELLSAADAAPEIVAPHVERSAVPGDRKAVAILRAAAERSLDRAPAAAAHWYAAAIQMLGDASSWQEHVELSIALAAALGAAGRLDGTRRHLAQAIALLPPEQDGMRLALVGQLAHLDAFNGDPGRAERALRRALAESAGKRGDRRAQLLVDASFDAWRTKRAEEAAALASQAREATQTPGIRSAASALLGLAAVSMSDASAARMHLDAAAAAIDGVADEALDGHVDALLYQAWGYETLGCPRAAAPLAERALRHSRRGAAAHLFTPLAVVLTMCDISLGELHDARRHAEDAVESALLARAGPNIAWSKIASAWVALEHDEIPEALSAAETAMSPSPGVAPGMICWVAPLVLAETYLSAGMAEAACECLQEESCPTGVLPAGHEPWRRRMLVQAALADGRTGDARSWMDALVLAADAFPVPLAIGQKLWGQAAFELANGEPSRATALACEASSCFSLEGLFVPALETQLLAARAARAGGQFERAAEMLRAARELSARHDATRLARICKAELDELDAEGSSVRRARPAAPDSLASLSTREREIAALIAHGSSNREIAQTLFLSVRTVETYVSHIFEKLGIHRRTALAAIVGTRFDPPAALTAIGTGSRHSSSEPSVKRQPSS